MFIKTLWFMTNLVRCNLMGNQLIPPTTKNYFAALNRMRESSNTNVGSPKNAPSPRKSDEVIEKTNVCTRRFIVIQQELHLHLGMT